MPDTVPGCRTAFRSNANIVRHQHGTRSVMPPECCPSRRLPLRRLLSMLRDYPRAAFLSALVLAEQYRLFDLDRLERMVLKQIAREYFVLTPTDESDE